MKTLTLNAWGENHQVFFHTNTYANNNNLYVGILCFDENGSVEPWSDLTVNLGNELPPDTAYIDTNNNDEDIMEWLVAHKLGYITGDCGMSGFCVYPEFKFNMDKLKEYMEETL